MKPETNLNAERLHHLDAVRAFALLLGVIFHASLSFVPMPIGWAVMDVSSNPLVLVYVLISHSFRMPLFFLIAGFFSRMTYYRKGSAGFLKSRTIRLLIPFVVGWFILWPLIASGWHMGAASMQGQFSFWQGLQSGFREFKNFSQYFLTHSHLWFLYYLVLATGLTLAVRTGLQSLENGYDKLLSVVDRCICRMSEKSCAWFAMAVPTAGVLWFMQGWGMDTPDKTLVPHIPLLAIYGGAFLIGWLLHRNLGELEKLSRITWIRGGLGVAGIVISVALGGIQGDPSHPQYLWARAGFCASYALMLWSLVFVTIGLFEFFASRPNKVVRYVADSSYWMYLIHLPVVVWLQVAISEWQTSWIVKWPLISVLTVLFCLLSYDGIVRSSWVGRVLNGRSKPRGLFKFRSTLV